MYIHLYINIFVFYWISFFDFYWISFFFFLICTIFQKEPWRSHRFFAVDSVRRVIWETFHQELWHWCASVTMKLWMLKCLSWVKTRWWFQIFYFFHPYLGKIPILTNIFQMGWNHQLDNFPTKKGTSLAMQCTCNMNMFRWYIFLLFWWDILWSL